MLSDEEHDLVEELVRLVRQRASESRLAQWFGVGCFNAVCLGWILPVVSQGLVGINLTRRRPVLLLSDITFLIGGDLAGSRSVRTIREIKERIVGFTDDSSKRRELLCHLFDAIIHPQSAAPKAHKREAAQSEPAPPLSRLDDKMMEALYAWTEKILAEENSENERREAESKARRFFGEEDIG